MYWKDTLVLYWCRSSLTHSVLLSKGTVHNCFILILCLVRVQTAVARLSLSKFWNTGLFSTILVWIALWYCIIRISLPPEKRWCCILLWEKKSTTYVLAVGELAYVHISTVMITEALVKCITYLLVCWKFQVIEVTAYVLRGWALLPATLIDRPWFFTWSVMVALISSVKTALTVLETPLCTLTPLPLPDLFQLFLSFVQTFFFLCLCFVLYQHWSKPIQNVSGWDWNHLWFGLFYTN